MLLSALEIESGAILDCDVCIVGAGAAGLTLAHELAGTGLQIIVLAGGARDKAQKRDQSLYQGTVLDPDRHSAADTYRERRYGGTTAIWGGRCLPYDEIDFEQRDFVPFSGWPYGRSALLPYFERAAPYFEIGVPDFDAVTALPHRIAAMVPGFKSDVFIDTAIERFSKPTNFGKSLQDHLHRSPTLRVLLDAHCTSLAGTPDGAAIDRVLCATFKPSNFTVKARAYVLAAGGIETARLLLAARDGIGTGTPLAMTSPWLGRGYMGHMYGSAGRIYFSIPPQAVNYDYETTPDGIYCRRRFWITNEAQRRLGILNTVFKLHYPTIADPSHHNPVLSAMYLVKDLILYEYSRRWREKRSASLFLRHVRNVVSHPLELSRFAVDWVRLRNLSERKMPSVALFSRTGEYTVEYHSEQVPTLDSGIALSEERDAFGMPRVVIDWHHVEQDVASIKAAYRELGRAIGESGVGRLDLRDDEIDHAVATEGGIDGHHVGMTRMAADPATGVVDADCKLFGIANGFVASASVLPTSGQANPTFMVGSLAIKLADHLKATLATASL